jgi:hypothetical protein
MLLNAVNSTEPMVTKWSPTWTHWQSTTGVAQHDKVKIAKRFSTRSHSLTSSGMVEGTFRVRCFLPPCCLPDLGGFVLRLRPGASANDPFETSAAKFAVMQQPLSHKAAGAR